MYNKKVDYSSMFIQVNIEKFFSLLGKGTTRDAASRSSFGISWWSVKRLANSGNGAAQSFLGQSMEFGMLPNTPRKHPWLVLASAISKPPAAPLLQKLEARATQLTGFRKQTMEAFAATAKDVATFKTHGYRKRVHPNTNHFMTIEDAELCQ